MSSSLQQFDLGVHLLGDLLLGKLVPVWNAQNFFFFSAVKILLGNDIVTFLGLIESKNIDIRTNLKQNQTQDALLLAGVRENENLPSCP